MIRTTYGVTASTSVAVGRIIASMSSHGSRARRDDRDGGQAAREDRGREEHDEQHPITNSGIAAKSSVASELVTSNARSRRSAA